MPPVLEPTNRERLHQVLSRRRDEIYMRIRELRRNQETEAELPPADSMEVARAAAEIETHAGLIGSAEDELALIDEALEKVECGSYGICADCGEEISLPRLRAVPAARYCIECQNKHAVVQRRWTEGIVIQPYDQLWTLPQEMRAASEVRVRTDGARRSVRYEEAPPADLPQPVKVIFPKPEMNSRQRRK